MLRGRFIGVNSAHRHHVSMWQEYCTAHAVQRGSVWMRFVESAPPKTMVKTMSKSSYAPPDTNSPTWVTGPKPGTRWWPSCRTTGPVPSIVQSDTEMLVSWIGGTPKSASLWSANAIPPPTLPRKLQFLITISSSLSSTRLGSRSMPYLHSGSDRWGTGEVRWCAVISTCEP